MTVLKDLKPKVLWKHFDEICKRPHCSKHEKLIQEYLVDFAKQHSLSYKMDKAGNIVIKKPATKGMEKKPIVILQGHMDMVCEKNSDVKHDFSKDPIRVVRDGDILTADGTTLGADNGIGLALSLAILEDKTLEHGPLECLFTVDEETGLTGAFALADDMLNGRLMLNLDSEDWGVLTVGCAGGGDSKIKLPLKTQKMPANTSMFTIKLTGLRGGHSGVDAHEQRGNALKILGRILWKVHTTYHLYLVDIKGGDKHNAIPREAFAQVAVYSDEVEGFKELVKKEEQSIQKEIKPIDPNLTVTIEAVESQTQCLESSAQNTLLHLIQGLPHGIVKMSYDIPGLVQTSTNFATIIIKDNAAHMQLSSRSSVMSELYAFRDHIRAIAQLASGSVTEDKPYPGWQPNLSSPLLAVVKKVYKDMYGKEPKVEAIHAGLECGIIGEKYPGMDMLSIGPTIKYPHSPEEQVLISTVEHCYKLVIDILNNI